MPPPSADGFKLHLAELAGIAFLVGHRNRGHPERVPYAPVWHKPWLVPGSPHFLLVVFLGEGRQAFHLDVVPVKGLQRLSIISSLF